MAKKIIFTLDELLKGANEEMGGSPGDAYFSTGNIDMVFRMLRKKGIKDIRVNVDQMLMIVLFIPGWWEIKEVLQEGRIDKFLGIKLRLDE